MKLTYMAAALMALVCVATNIDLAHAAADTTWSPGPVYTWLTTNVLVPVIGGLVLAALTWIGNLLQKNYNIKLSDSLKAELQQTAENAAGRIFASQGEKFATTQIDVKSPLVADELPKVIARAEDAYTGLNLTPDRVKDLILGKIGILQAQAQSAAPVVIPVIDPVGKTAP